MQTRINSLIETAINIIIGFIVSVILTAYVLPFYGHDVSFSHNIQITMIFTIASLIRGYFVRRFFNGMRR
jgi:heme/copper-type cytochrome/quinol oxidase subunit 4